MKKHIFIFRPLLLIALVLLASPASADKYSKAKSENHTFADVCVDQVPNADAGRIICADIAALDQTLVYNRFGSFNPFAMMFALQRDLSPLHSENPPKRLNAQDCAERTGTEDGRNSQKLEAGNVRLKDCKRPRPMTLRVNVGDTLLVRVSNLLHVSDADNAPAPDFSRDFCNQEGVRGYYPLALREAVSEGPEDLLRHGEVSCLERSTTEHGEGQQEVVAEESEVSTHADWPNTRALNFVVQGLTPLPDPITHRVHGACLGTDAVAPDDSFVCRYKIDQEGTYFLASPAAPAGGEGDGGSIVHGLFGAIVAQRQGSRWYRSQVSDTTFDKVWPARTEDGAPRHSRTGLPDYERTDDKEVPYLNMARPIDGTSQEHFDKARALELVHTDLNAIVFCSDQAEGNDCRDRTTTDLTRTEEPGYRAFREFSVFFHDELKTFYTRHFDDIEKLGQMSGIKDGFALNYGASGMGSILMANRKGIGPSADCKECLYEEFFLTSWANGDPALLERFPDDPSNVHHSYLNDPVVFRNFHAGPKETHVFHLHAHQWFAGNDPSRGTYLDSQTVAPQQGFTYNIYHGGKRGYNDLADGVQTDGWWDTQGSGNRNRTLGDSIFHCHLYPHFAQGMWALWRVHDVLEDGTRKMPDGQSHDGLSIDFPDVGANGHKRAGSVDRKTGEWLAEQEGTPIPAIVPLPGEPLPLLPTYAEAGDGNIPMPGFPFYMAGEAGHRPPQAPLDIARDLGDAPDSNTQIDERSEVAGWLDGGIGRHIIKDGSSRKLGIKLPDIDPTSLGEKRGAYVSQIVAKSFALGDLSASLDVANIELLDNAGTPMERGAMGFHFNGEPYKQDGEEITAQLILRDAHGNPTRFDSGVYASPVSEPPAGNAVRLPQFAVNAGAPKPGAPFADPCSAPLSLEQRRSSLRYDPLFKGQGPLLEYAADPMLLGFRRYEVSAVQVDMIVNQAGWHDPQARINVLTQHSGNYKDGSIEASNRISPTISDSEEPFFFRASSGECIEFRHTNELPKELELDDFQVKTPTDTIGQHIHLVKFDVTASDGSGNGWNYEDGTFAADELAARRCAGLQGTVSDNIPGSSFRRPDASECSNGKPTEKEIWRQPLKQNREKFQTTVQRWFADPILSRDENRVDRDRTLRTVFTHDHFAASSIQQHGFYSALLIEPGVEHDSESGDTISTLEKVCEEDGETCVELPFFDWPTNSEDPQPPVAWSGDVMVGSRKRISTLSDPIHPDFREFALSIADFALLYDPRDRISKDEFTAVTEDDNKYEVEAEIATSDQGMHQLYCESFWRKSPLKLEERCGNHPEQDEQNASWFFPGDVPPAWIAGGAYRDDIHRSRYQGDLIGDLVGGQAEVDKLRDHAISWRQKAAGLFAVTDESGRRLGNDVATLAKPVAPPLRPESISVDHHDPYLVNYRGAPFPLRIGDKAGARSDVLNTDAALSQSNDCKPLQMTLAGKRASDEDAENEESEVVSALKSGNFDECSIHRQVAGKKGDMAGVMLSSVHGDPETPLLEAYQSERMVFRLIQGAQEVQHTFNITGQPFKRNIDQDFPRGMQPLGVSDSIKANPTLRQQCFEAMRDGRPAEYRKWLDSAPAISAENPESVSNAAFFQNLEKLLATCDNIEGFTFAQEIGLSEHFEMQGSLRSDVSASVELSLLDQLVSDDANTASDDNLVENSIDSAPTFSDYLYNFGSVDAQWNGAWGLVRIFNDPTAIDPATRRSAKQHLHSEVEDNVAAAPQDQADGDEGIPIGLRLGEPVDSSLEGTAGFSNINQERETISGLSCPLPGVNGTRHTEAVIVALETRKLWSDRGTDYAGPRHDPDGLMLALIDPEALVDDGFRASNMQWESLNADDVLSAVLADGRYTDGPKPFTLRVNAGDCVRLRIVNLLEEHTGREGLRDLLGDARLPPIVPLNADPAYGGVTFEDTHGDKNGDTNGDSTSLQRVGLLERPEDISMPGGLRPSASLALNIGLPGLNLIRDVPLAFGYNKPALPPLREKVSVSREMRFFAGRFRIDVKEDEDISRMQEHVAEKLVAHMQSAAGGWLQGGLQFFPAANLSADEFNNAFIVSPAKNVSNAQGKRLFELLGEPYVAELNTANLSGFPEIAEPDVLVLHEGTDSATDLAERYCSGSNNLTQCRIQVMSAHSTLVNIARAEALQALNDRTHWIPYAFGLVPVRSTSDLISHVTHGLFGSIDVLPEHWELGEEHGVTRMETVGNVQYRSMSYKESGEDGHPAVFHVPSAIGSLPNVASSNVVRENTGGVVGSSSGKIVTTTYPVDGGTRIREFVLYYQDGLNLHDDQSAISWKWDDDLPVLDENVSPLKIVPECPVCDDSYDRGDYAVNYRSVAFSQVLREQLPLSQQIDWSVEASDDLNVYTFPPDYLAKAQNALRLEACEGEQIVIRVMHPGGRARQRAFVVNGYSYEDLFPGFGFPRSALLAPGKSISAWLAPLARPGVTLWHDGPTQIRSGGVWGLLDVASADSKRCRQ